MADTRVYFVVSTTIAVTPSVAQWRTLFAQAKIKPLAAAILAVINKAAQNYVSIDKFSQGTGQVNKNVLGGFEIRDSDLSALLAVLDTQAALIGESGTNKAKFAAVLQAELRIAATDIGYTTNQANTMTVTVLNAGANQFDRAVATATVQAYLAANAAIWYAA